MVEACRLGLGGACPYIRYTQGRFRYEDRVIYELAVSVDGSSPIFVCATPATPLEKHNLLIFLLSYPISNNNIASIWGLN